MNKLRINALLACLLLALGSSALANDPPKEPAKDAKKEEEKPAEPDLPYKPYPKNAVPKAFLPKKDEQKDAKAKPEAGNDKPAEKVADKSERDWAILSYFCRRTQIRFAGRSRRHSSR